MEGMSGAQAGIGTGKFLITMLIAGLCSEWAHRKGYNNWTWFFAILLAGYNLFIVPLISLALLKDQRKIVAATGAPDPAVVGRGNAIAWIYVRIGILLTLGLLLLMFGMLNFIQ